MRKLAFFASLTLAGLLISAWNSIDWAMAQRRAFAPHPDVLHQVGKIYMTEEQILLTRVHPRENTPSIQYWLLSRRNVFPFLYIVEGFGGSCAAIWLLLASSKMRSAAVAWDELPLSVLLSGLAGLVAYLLVKACAGLAGQDVAKALDVMEVFPMLAGISNTVLYKAVPGLLHAILEAAKTGLGRFGSGSAVVAIGIGVALSPAHLNAQRVATLAGDTARRVMYSCVDPGTCSCIAFNATEKKECAQCKGWKETQITEAMFAALTALNSTTYKDDARGFLYASRKQLFGIGSAGNPVSVAVVYQNPAAHGLQELDAEASKSGSLVLFPTFAGVVIDSQGDVVYPSAQKDGQLRVARLDALRGAGAPKLVIPNQARVAKPPDRE